MTKPRRSHRKKPTTARPSAQATLPLQGKLREARVRVRAIRAAQEAALEHRHIFTPTPPFDIGKFEYIDGVQSIHAQTRLSPQVFQLWRRLGEMEVIYGHPLGDVGPAPALLVIHKRDAQNLHRNGISVRLNSLKKSRLDPEVFCRLVDLSDEMRFRDTLNELVQFKASVLPKPARRRAVLAN